MCKSKCSLPKNARLQVIIGILENLAKDQGLSTLEVHQLAVSKGIEVSIRTILRDLNELSLYTSISEEERDGILYWIWTGVENSESMSSLDRFWREQFLQYVRTKEVA